MDENHLDVRPSLYQQVFVEMLTEDCQDTFSNLSKYPIFAGELRRKRKKEPPLQWPKAVDPRIVENSPEAQGEDQCCVSDILGSQCPFGHCYIPLGNYLLEIAESNDVPIIQHPNAHHMLICGFHWKQIKYSRPGVVVDQPRPMTEWEQAELMLDLDEILKEPESKRVRAGDSSAEEEEEEDEDEEEEEDESEEESESPEVDLEEVSDFSSGSENDSYSDEDSDSEYSSSDDQEPLADVKELKDEDIERLEVLLLEDEVKRRDEIDSDSSHYSSGEEAEESEDSGEEEEVQKEAEEPEEVSSGAELSEGDDIDEEDEEEQPMVNGFHSPGLPSSPVEIPGLLNHVDRQQSSEEEEEEEEEEVPMMQTRGRTRMLMLNGGDHLNGREEEKQRKKRREEREGDDDDEEEEEGQDSGDSSDDSSDSEEDSSDNSDNSDDDSTTDEETSESETSSDDDDSDSSGSEKKKKKKKKGAEDGEEEEVDPEMIGRPSYYRQLGLEIQLDHESDDDLQFLAGEKGDGYDMWQEEGETSCESEESEEDSSEDSSEESEDEDVEDEEEAQNPDELSMVLQGISALPATALRRYRRYHDIPTCSTATKSSMLSGIARHLTNFETHPHAIPAAFILKSKTAKRTRSGRRK